MMHDSLEAILKEAAKTGEVVRIIYRGGSQPGTVREVSPILVTPIEMRARDIATGVAKTYKLDKVQIADSATAAAADNRNFSDVPEDALSIEESLKSHIGDLQALGWHVELSKDSISLHRFFKNGKPRKSPDAMLTFREYVTEVFVELDGTLVQEERKSSRPYYVSSARLGSPHTFGKFSKAKLLFLEESRASAPKNDT